MSANYCERSEKLCRLNACNGVKQVTGRGDTEAFAAYFGFIVLGGCQEREKKKKRKTDREKALLV